MASITTREGKRGKSYQVKVRVKGHPPYSASFSRLTDAKRWAQKTESAVKDGVYFQTSESQKHTLAELIDRYIRTVLPEKKTAKDQLRQLNFWKSRLGHLKLVAVTPAILAEVKEELVSIPNGRGKNRANATVARYMASLSHVFTIGFKEWRWMLDNPLSSVTKPKVKNEVVRFLSDQERGRLLKVCRESGHPFLYTAVVVSLSTGARQGEIFGLKWKDIDLKRGQIILYDTKNGDVRPVPLKGHALDLMKALHKNQTLGVEWIFPGKPNRKTGKIGPINLRAPWTKALEKAGIKNFRWHDLRHSAASYLAMNGASLNEIAAILGHRQISMVQRYAHLSPQHTASVVERMNEKIFGGG